MPPSAPKRKHFYVDGYPSLAAFIASDRDGTAAIYKRFGRLAARNLLSLQSELAELEAQLDDYDIKDQSSRESMQSLRNWSDYKARVDDDSCRMELLGKIRVTMKEYREALILDSTIASIRPPDRKTLKAFRTNFFHGRPGEPETFPTLGGTSASLYDDPDDIIALHTEECDRLTSFVKDHLGFLFSIEESGSASNVSSVGYASGKAIESFIAYLSTALAAVLLFGAILVLYHVDSEELKLGLIALFTLLFAASIGLLTNAKRSEVYASTAAYAAVLVVFVSGDFNDSSKREK